MDLETKPLWATECEAMGKTWRVELWPDSDMNREGTDLGSARGSRLRIRVNAAIPMDSRETVLLHEVIEMVDAEMALTLSHETIDRLQAGLFAFLRGFGLWRDFPWPDREEAIAEKPLFPGTEGLQPTSGSTVHPDQWRMVYGEEPSGSPDP